MAKISIIVPSYNEEKNTGLLAQRVAEVFKDRGDEYEIIFINDGSKDNTLQELKNLHAQDPEHHQFLSFSRNFGHQNALRAGLRAARGDAVVSMDADLQHPPEMLPQMIDLWKQGYAIVYTLRKDDASLPFMKRVTSSAFYNLINALSGLKLEKGAADFRLLDRKVVNVLNDLKESSIFYRGFISNIGFKKIALDYVPGNRIHGKSQYTLRKMINLALNGITSFSTLPLQISTWVGTVIALGSFLYSMYALFVKLFADSVVPGWSSTLVGIYFLGGVQLMMIGILGDYLGRVFIEIKQRPSFIVEESSL